MKKKSKQNQNRNKYGYMQNDKYLVRYERALTKPILLKD